MTAPIPAAELPPLTRPEWDIEELLVMRPEWSAPRVLRCRMSQARADALCLERYGRTFAQERAHRKAQDNATKAKNRFWCGLGASRRSSRRTCADDGGPSTSRLNARS